MGWINAIATGIGVLDALNIDFGQHYVCDAVDMCNNDQTNTDNWQQPAPTPAPTNQNTRKLPVCQPNLHVSGYEVYPGMNGWYESLAPGMPWSVFNHKNRASGNLYQIAPDHTRGMWIIGKDLCDTQSTVPARGTRCSFQPNYLDRIVVTSDRPVYDPRYLNVSHTEYYTFGSHMGNLNNGVSEADAMFFEQRLNYFIKQDHNCDRNVNNAQGNQQDMQYCGPLYNHNRTDFSGQPDGKVIGMLHDNIEFCEYSRDANDLVIDAVKEKCKQKIFWPGGPVPHAIHILEDNPSGRVNPSFDAVKNRRLQTVSRDKFLRQMETSGVRSHPDGTSTKTPDYSVSHLHGGYPLFNVSSWCYDDQTQINGVNCRSTYPDNLYPFVMPEPCFPGKYWATLRAAATVQTPQYDDVEHIYAKRHLRPGIKRLPGNQFERNFGRDDIMVWGMDGRGFDPDLLGLKGNVENHRLHEPYGYMSYAMQEAILTTPYNPSMWSMRQNTRHAGDCAAEFEQRVQLMRHHRTADGGLGIPETHTLRTKSLLGGGAGCNSRSFTTVQNLRVGGYGHPVSFEWCQAWAYKEFLGATINGRNVLTISSKKHSVSNTMLAQPMGCWYDYDNKQVHWTSPDDFDSVSETECSSNARCIDHPNGNVFTSGGTQFKGSHSTPVCPLGIRAKQGSYTSILTPGVYTEQDLEKKYHFKRDSGNNKIYFDEIDVWPQCRVTLYEMEFRMYSADNTRSANDPTPFRDGIEKRSDDSTTLSNYDTADIKTFAGGSCIKNPDHVVPRNINPLAPGFFMNVPGESRDCVERDYQKHFDSILVSCKTELFFDDIPESMNVYHVFSERNNLDILEMDLGPLGTRKIQTLRRTVFPGTHSLTFNEVNAFLPISITKRMDVPPFCQVKFCAAQGCGVPEAALYRNLYPWTTPIFIKNPGDDFGSNADYPYSQAGIYQKSANLFERSNLWSGDFVLDCNITRTDPQGVLAPDWSLHAANASKHFHVKPDIHSDPFFCDVTDRSAYDKLHTTSRNVNYVTGPNDPFEGNLGLVSRVQLGTDERMLENPYHAFLSVDPSGPIVAEPDFSFRLSQMNSESGDFLISAETCQFRASQFNAKTNIAHPYRGEIRIGFEEGSGYLNGDFLPGCIYVNRGGILWRPTSSNNDFGRPFYNEIEYEITNYQPGFYHVVVDNTLPIFWAETTVNVPARNWSNIHEFGNCGQNGLRRYKLRADVFCVKSGAPKDLTPVWPRGRRSLESVSSMASRYYNTTNGTEIFIFNTAGNTTMFPILESKASAQASMYPGLGNRTSCSYNGLGVGRAYAFRSVGRSDPNGEHGSNAWYDEYYVPEEVCRLLGKTYGFTFAHTSCTAPDCAPMGCYLMRGQNLYWNNWKNGSFTDEKEFPRFFFARDSLARIERATSFAPWSGRVDDTLIPFRWPLVLGGEGLDDICQRNQHFSRLWHASSGVAQPRMTRGRHAGLSPLQQEACQEKIREMPENINNNLGEHSQGDIYTINEAKRNQLSYDSSTHPLWPDHYYPTVEFVHQVTAKTRTENSGPGTGYVRAEDHNWVRARQNWALFVGNSDEKRVLEVTMQRRDYTGHRYRNYWHDYREVNHGFVVDTGSGGLEARESKALFLSSNSTGWGPFSERNLNIWTQDWYSMLRSPECGDSPDLMPTWAGPNPINKGVIAEFKTERLTDEGYASFLGFPSVNEMIVYGDLQKMFLMTSTDVTNEWVCQSDRTILVGVPAARFTTDAFARALYPDGLYIVFFYNSLWLGMPAFVGCLNPVGIHDGNDLNIGLRASFTELNGGTVCPQAERIHFRVDEFTGNYKLIFPDHVESDLLTLGNNHEALRKPDFSFSRILDIYTHDPDAGSAAAKILSMASKPNPGYIPPSTAMRTRHGEWYCKPTDNLQDPCCLSYIDDPNPPGMDRVVNNDYPRRYRGCCIFPSFPAGGMSDTTFPRHSSRNSNIISYFGADMTDPSFCTKDYVLRHIRPSVDARVQWLDSIRLNDNAAYENRQGGIISRRAVFRLYPNAMEILDTCNSPAYWNEKSPRVTPIGNASLYDSGQQQTLSNARMASNTSAVRALGGFTTGAAPGSALATSFDVTGYSYEQFCLVNDNDEPVLTSWVEECSPYRGSRSDSDFSRAVIGISAGQYACCSESKGTIDQYALLHNQFITNFWGNGISGAGRTSGYGVISSARWCEEHALRLGKQYISWNQLSSIAGVDTAMTRGCWEYTGVDSNGILVTNAFYYNEYVDELVAKTNTTLAENTRTWLNDLGIADLHACSSDLVCYQPGSFQPSYLQSRATISALGTTGSDCGPGKTPFYDFYPGESFQFGTTPIFGTMSHQRKMINATVFYAFVNQQLRGEVIEYFSAPPPPRSHLYNLTTEKYFNFRGWANEYNNLVHDDQPLWMVGMCEAYDMCSISDITMPVGRCELWKFDPKLSYQSLRLTGSSGVEYPLERNWDMSRLVLDYGFGVRIQQGHQDAAGTNLANDSTFADECTHYNIGGYDWFPKLQFRLRCASAPKSLSGQPLIFHESPYVAQSDVFSLPSVVTSTGLGPLSGKNWYLKREVHEKSTYLNDHYNFWKNTDTIYFRIDTDIIQQLFTQPEDPIWVLEENGVTYMLLYGGGYFGFTYRYAPWWWIYNATGGNMLYIGQGYHHRPDVPNDFVPGTTTGVHFYELSASGSVMDDLSVAHTNAHALDLWENEDISCLPVDDLGSCHLINQGVGYEVLDDYYPYDTFAFPLSTAQEFNKTMQFRKRCQLVCIFHQNFRPSELSCTFNRIDRSCYLCPNRTVTPAEANGYDSYGCGEEYVEVNENAFNSGVFDIINEETDADNETDTSAQQAEGEEAKSSDDGDSDDNTLLIVIVVLVAILVGIMVWYFVVKKGRGRRGGGNASFSIRTIL